MKHLYTFALFLLTAQLSYGAELYIRVARNGSFVASVSNQVQSNSTNIFRFFELPGGSTTIRITDQQYGNVVYSGFMNLGQNQRIIGEINSYGNLNIIETQTINTTWYNTSIPQQPVYGSGYPNGGYQHPGYPDNGGYYDQSAFNQFLNILDKESFDSNKLTTAQGYVDKTSLSAQQITEIAKKFTFDSNRLDWAKYAYKNCYDKANYFLLKSTFTFSSSFSALEDYTRGQ